MAERIKIGDSIVPFGDVQYTVPVFSDGTIELPENVLPNGNTVAKLDDESFQKVKAEYEESILREASSRVSPFEDDSKPPKPTPSPKSNFLPNQGTSPRTVAPPPVKEKKSLFGGKSKGGPKEPPKKPPNGPPRTPPNAPPKTPPNGGSPLQRPPKPPKQKPPKSDSFKSHNTDIQGDKGKKTLVIVVYIVAVILIFFAAKVMLNGQQEEVSVVRLNKDMLAGDLLTEADIEEFKMLKVTYEKMGKVKYEDKETGKTKTEQIIVLWDEREKVVGEDKPQYMTSYVQAGQYVTLRHVTTEKIVRNPWLSSVSTENEIYTLPFDADGVDTRLLLPGTHMRVRIVAQVERQKDQSLPDSGENIVETAAVEKMTETERKLYEEEKKLQASIAASLESLQKESGVAAPDDGTNAVAAAQIADAGNAADVKEMPKSFVVFEDLVTVDMLNSSQESIFDIYMALLRTPINERIKYLETQIIEEETDQATSFQDRVTPTSLVFELTKEQANAMAEFENFEGAVIKYTILPTKDEDGELLASFMEISDQINEIFEQALNEVAGVK